jgi:nucleoside-diphosphate-sugar epimerase
MRIFVAGASGAIGRRLIPLLLSDGHHVTATTRTPAKTAALRDQGADAVVVDGLDRDAVMRAVAVARPEAIVHEMTAIVSTRNLRRFDDEFAATNRLRTEGTEHLLAAARAADARMVIAQSYSGWPNDRHGSRVKTEDDPMDANPPKAMTRTLDAIRTLEHLVLESELIGIVLRYGSLYGPGTSISREGEVGVAIRQRKFPVVGDGAGVWSFLHVDDAARATARAIELGVPGVFNIVDDEPAEVSEWLPELARAVGAKPPFHVPLWLGRLMAGDVGVSLMTKVRGSSNARAKRMLGWQPSHPSWREGFRSL